MTYYWKYWREAIDDSNVLMMILLFGIIDEVFPVWPFFIQRILGGIMMHYNNLMIQADHSWYCDDMMPR